VRIQYSGPFDAVLVPDLGEREIQRGVPIEVPDAIGASLCQQPAWHEVGVPASLRARGGSRGGGETGATHTTGAAAGEG